MIRIITAVFAVLLIVVSVSNARSQGIDDPLSAPIEVLERSAPAEHPLHLFIHAIRKFEAGEKDDAVRWLYVAQIRTRFRLMVEPDLDPSGEPALFASFMEAIGRPINEWAGGDVDLWTRQMQAALDWDAANDNGFTPKADHPGELETVRAGLAELIVSTRAAREEIRATREANGLENRRP